MTSFVKLHPASRALPHVKGNTLAGTLVAGGTGLKVASEFS